MHAMETKNILHMTKGDGEFSYAHNSNAQNRAFVYVSKPYLETAVRSLLKSANDKSPCKVLRVADLGCGVGPTPISLISTVVSTVHNTCMEMKQDDEQMPEIQIFMSDLQSNDFNLLFKQVGEIDCNNINNNNNNLSCFVMATSGSFYARLFPCDTLHLVVSNYAIHWLSRVPKGLCDEIGTPMNKGHIVASTTSHPQVLKAYYSQFHQDFTTFLEHRSREVVANGYMILATFCRPSIEPLEAPLFDFLYQALACLVAKGVIEEEKLDSFNLPIYFLFKEEINELVREEGSFVIEHLKVIQDDARNGAKDDDPRSFAEHVAKCGRSITEALISSHFGDGVWDELYNVLYETVLKHFESSTSCLTTMFNIVIVLRKK